jgi:hypothetical protein
MNITETRLAAIMELAVVIKDGKLENIIHIS